MAYEAVIGLECHIQVATRSKMFCDCPAEFGAEPNANVCPVCLGLPGALPRANGAAITRAMRLGLALECRIRRESVFARKNYFYPDMPKNYQITQYDQPLCEGGALPVSLTGGERSFDLTRIHVEEDTGKSFHPERHGDRSLSRVDFNRAGVPLLELVTEPVFRDPAECYAFLTALRRLVRWLGISGGDMEKGQLRCDANVSLRPVGSEPFGTKTEIKNLNSIRGVERGITAEIARQRGALESGDTIQQATLLYDADHDKLAVMRSKEHAHDYRYFPEPDLPLLHVDEAWLERVRAELPEMPWRRAVRFAERYGLPAYDAGVLTDQRELADYYEAVAAQVDPKQASNWVMGEALRHIKALDLSVVEWAERVPPENLAKLIEAVQSVTLTAGGAKEILEAIAASGADPASLFAHHEVKSTADELLPLVRAVIDDNPGPVGQYLGGKQATLGFLVGQVMKKSDGQAVAQTVKELLEAEIAKRAPAR
ncbi:MAG TPA: Asp-tRNA(Asn)/Glu-tRNA(Gln) amidotransferase subunit GatB [Candidatus Limnocylindria bacterium]|nr:Asp-tRNA(Asn)/Glu-tRNA(Gln) amidotransferase subunit GatB [Candidatus Limnocylindria bacterium]